jgi:hypothetical protein
MIHRIMLAAALLAVPAIVVAAPVQGTMASPQHPDSSKAKKQSNTKSHEKSHKKSHEKSAKPAEPKAAPKAAPHDSGK